VTRSVTVNSKTCEIAEPGQPLLAFLRTGLGLTGAKPGCGEGTCGACSVLVDGGPVLACQVRVGEPAGRSVTTIKGLADPGPLHPVQRALAAERAAQCGYCTPGIALRAAALLAADPDPDDGQIAAALNPCLCRCGCYPRITRAVHRAAAMIREDDEAAPSRSRSRYRPRWPGRRGRGTCPRRGSGTGSASSATGLSSFGPRLRAVPGCISRCPGP
jgi:isoquinoline 1-oxidoreductase alpha subunit